MFARQKKQIVTFTNETEKLKAALKKEQQSHKRQAKSAKTRLHDYRKASQKIRQKYKTAQWLKLKSDEEKKQLFKTCIKLGREQRQLYKQRKHSIETY